MKDADDSGEGESVKHAYYDGVMQSLVLPEHMR